MITKVHNIMENFLTNLNHFILKWKTNKLRPTKTVRHKVENAIINIHVKVMQTLSMTTVFNNEATSSAYTAMIVQQ